MQSLICRQVGQRFPTVAIEGECFIPRDCINKRINSLLKKPGEGEKQRASALETALQGFDKRKAQAAASAAADAAAMQQPVLLPLQTFGPEIPPGWWIGTDLKSHPTI
jgi:hypothetical protein